MSDKIQRYDHFFDECEYGDYVKFSDYLTLKSRCNVLKRLLVDCQEVIDELRDGEGCDHSVGICWCGVNSIQDAIDEVLMDIGD